MTIEVASHCHPIFYKIFVCFSDYWGGWACFCISIVMIGVLTAFIGDLASHFGCTIGLKDAITAISFVALGTSVPGMLLQLTTNWYGKCSKTLNTFISSVSK